MASEDMRPDTRLITAGRRKQWRGSNVNVPVERSSTILFDSVDQMRASYPPAAGRPSYGRNGTATHWALMEALTALEPGAEGSWLFPSGAAAVAAALLTVVGPGDELLMVDSVYGPTRGLCDQLLARIGVKTIYYSPLAAADDVEALCTPATRALFMESPGSLTFEVQDVPGLCALAKTRGITTLIDNTWATPFYFPAIDKGIDLSILACTKYVAGHSDVMLGSVTANADWWSRLERCARGLGQIASPDDAWLAARGLRTLSVRLERHQENALAVARWLAAHPRVAAVLHPALKGSPGHAYWKRDFLGSTGLFAFALKDSNTAARDAFVDRLHLFGIGYSWGGFESLAVPADPLRTAGGWTAPGPLVRLHVGLEDPQDLIADLDRAFEF